MSSKIRITIVIAALLLCAATLYGLEDLKSEDRAALRGVAILSTPGNGSETYLHRMEVGKAFPPPLAHFTHLPGAAVNGITLPDGTVLAIADYLPGRDRSFGSALFRLAPGAEAVRLCDNVVFASRPLITPDGRAVIQRGHAGPPTKAGETRSDSLSIDEVDPQTGVIRTLWKGTGYVAYTAAIFKRELVIYQIDPSGARLLGINIDTGKERIILASLLPFASDFSVNDAGDLFFQDRDESQSDLWGVERLNLNTGAREMLDKEKISLAPRSWPHGTAIWNSQNGLKSIGKLASSGSPTGVVDIQGFSADGRTAVALVYESGNSIPDVSIIDASGVELGRLYMPEHTFFAVAGFLP